MHPRSEQTAESVPLDAPGIESAPLDVPGHDPAAAEARKAKTVKTLRVLGLMALYIYASGVLVSHAIYSEDDRTACHRAGGLLGRIWCPKFVDTEGFRVHFVRALGWPVHVFEPSAAPPAPAEYFEKALAAYKRANVEEPAHLRAAREREAVSEVQVLLNKLGYEIGDADGVAGNRTRAAISKFQLRDGMQVSGLVSDELVARLLNSVRASEAETAGNR